MVEYRSRFTSVFLTEYFYGRRTLILQKNQGNFWGNSKSPLVFCFVYNTHMTVKATDKKCSACGTSPVNHRFILILSILEETIGQAGDSLFSFAHTGKWQNLTNQIEKFLFVVFCGLRIARFKDDIEKAETGRSKLIWEEARRRGDRKSVV